jgi:hypothetical protein
MDVEVGKLEIGIVVRDVEAVTPFYRDGLGLTHVLDLNTKLGLNRRFAWGEAVIVVMQLTEPPTVTHPPDGTAGHATGVRYVVFREDNLDLEAILERCEAVGGTGYGPIKEMGEWRLLVLEDPEGTCHVEVVTRAKLRDARRPVRSGSPRASCAFPPSSPLDGPPLRGLAREPDHLCDSV